MEKILKDQLPGGRFQGVSAKRSQAMASIKNKGNKTTELRLRLGLVRARCRGWNMNANGLKGKPDFYFPCLSLVVFIDGCYWHGCETCGHFPRANSGYWKAKILRNRERDVQVTQCLTNEGYTVLRFWEHELAYNLEDCIAQIRRRLQGSVADR